MLTGTNVPDLLPVNPPDHGCDNSLRCPSQFIPGIIREAERAVGKRGRPGWHEQMIGALAYLVYMAREDLRDLRMKYEVEDD